MKEIEKRSKYFDLAKELKQRWNMKVTVFPNLIGAIGTVTKALVMGRFGYRKTSRHHPNYSIINVGHNTEKSPGDLKRLAVTQTTDTPPVNAGMKNSQWSMNNNNNNDIYQPLCSGRIWHKVNF